MKAKELRIGNYVKLDGEVIQITPMFIVEQLHSDIANVDYLDPIILDKNELLKLGFKISVHSGQHVSNENVFYNKKINITLFLRSDLRGIDYPFVDINKLNIKLEHVHKLQNLYYYLCGEELTYII
jgi:hypothetical protein